jgi:hypothetical protein
VVQGLAVILCQRINPSDAGLDAVADGSIDQPILAAKRNGRLGVDINPAWLMGLLDCWESGG